MTPSRGKGHALPLVAGLAGIAAIGVLAVVLDWHEVRRLAGQANWWFTGPALVAAALSYGALSGGLVTIGRVVGLRVPRGIFLRIAFISVAINHVVSMGGVAGYSIRTMLIVRHGGRAGPALTMSFLHSYLNNVILATLLQVGLIELALGSASKPGLREVLLFSAVLSMGCIVLCGAAVFSNRVRTRLLRGVNGSTRVLPRRLRPRVLALSADIGATLASTTQSFRATPRAAIAPLTFFLVDWVATFATLWCCLAAFGDRVDAGVLVGAGAIGMTAGFLSLIPGGIGVQEGSMAVVFSWFGVQLEHAALAAVLFRVVYYFVPFLVSLPLYLGIARVDEGGPGIDVARVDVRPQ